jgi:hypothetical protein
VPTPWGPWWAGTCRRAWRRAWRTAMPAGNGLQGTFNTNSQNCECLAPSTVDWLITKWGTFFKKKSWWINGSYHTLKLLGMDFDPRLFHQQLYNFISHDASKTLFIITQNLGSRGESPASSWKSKRNDLHYSSQQWQRPINRRQRLCRRSRSAQASRSNSLSRAPCNYARQSWEHPSWEDFSQSCRA